MNVLKPLRTGAASGLVSATPATSSTALAPSQTDLLSPVRLPLALLLNCPVCTNGPWLSALNVIEPPGAISEPRTVTCSGDPRPILAPASATTDAPVPIVTPPVTPGYTGIGTDVLPPEPVSVCQAA